MNSMGWEPDNCLDMSMIKSTESVFLDQVLVITDKKLGGGNEKLGESLMNGYIHSLVKCTPYPKAILFLNAGVHLVVEESPVINSLRVMEAAGVKILSCGTCLDFYMIKDKLCVGGVTNMYKMVELINDAGNTIKL